MTVFIKNKLFRKLLINQSISNFGDIIFYLAFITYISKYTFAPTAILLMTLSETIPNIIEVFTSGIADFQTKRIDKYISISLIKIICYALITILLLKSELSIWGVFLICLLNLFSDSLGNFANAMLIPIYLKIFTSEESLSEAMGFNQATASIINVVGSLTGGVLVGYLSIIWLSCFNVLTFFIAFIGILSLRKKIIVLDEVAVSKTININNYIKHLKSSIQQLFSFRLLSKYYCILGIGQTIIAVLLPISSIILIKNPFMHFKIGPSLSILNICLFIGMILGNLLVKNIFSMLSIKNAILMSQIMNIIILLGFFLSNFGIILIGTLGNAFWLGALNPKLQEEFYKQIPEEFIATIQSSLIFVITLVPNILSIIFVFFASQINIKFVVILIAILIGVAIYSILRISKDNLALNS